MPAITITRQFGSGGGEVARLVAEALGWRLVDNDFIDGIAKGLRATPAVVQAIDERSPSLAEVSSVAVAKSEHGNGLGTEVVLGVERLARARDINEIFALSLTDKFFIGLDYVATSISRYPEKLARYDVLARSGVEIVPKRCFQKVLSKWGAPTLVG